MASARVDKWLWAIRAYKTRALATEACRAGHVEVNDRTAKASSLVGVGDRIRVRAHGRDRDLEVVLVIEKRVAPSAAASCFVDHSPPPPPPNDEPPNFVRAPSSGRPTKRER